jgi:tetratricopeptide (TPR) repeat protein
LMPVGLCPFYDISYVPGPTLAGFFVPMLVLAVLGVGMWLWARRSRTAAMAIFWTVFPLLAVLNLRVFPADEIAHDRYLYIPSIGFSLLAALGLRWLQQRWRTAALRIPRLSAMDPARLNLVLPLVIATILGAGTALQAKMWQNEIVLYARALTIAPRSATVRNNLGTAFINKGLYQDAVRVLLPLLEQDPQNWYPAFNLGIAYEKLGDWGASEDFFNRAMAINPADSRPLYQKGVIELQSGHLDEASGYARKAVQLSPDRPGYHFLLGMILKEQKQFPDALIEFRMELAGHPEQFAAGQQIEALQSLIGRVDLATHPQSASTDKQ